jgi:iron complex outermembrane recepter protein
MSKYCKHAFLSGLSVFTLATTAVNAQAATQQPAAEAGAADASDASDAEQADVGEIIVTAQKRSESLQNVPISIAAFGARDLEIARVSETADYLEQVSNVTFAKIGNNDTDTSVRGVSSGLGGITDPVGVSLDGLTLVSIDTSVFLSTGVLDLDRIEVLRGPQGTLNGGNALAGAINFVPTKPDIGEFSGQATLDIGRFDRRFVSGSVNVPFSDKAAVRFFAYGDASDGAVRNIGPAGGSSSYDRKGGRASIRIEPTSSLTLDASIAYEKRKAGFDSQLPIDVYFSEERRDERIARIAELGGDYFDADFIGEVGNDGGQIKADNPDRSNAKVLIATAAVNYKTDSLSFDLQYGRYDYSNSESEDDDKSEFALGVAEFGIDSKSDAIEARVTSTSDGSLNFLAGVVYLNEKFDGRSRSFEGDGIDVASLALVEQGLLSRRLKRIAGFGTVFWNITDQIELTGGLRVTREKLAYGDDFTDEALLVPSPLISATTTEAQPRITLSYKPASNVNIYAQYARGSRSGFANDSRAVDAGVAAAQVDPEELTNYEVGVKGGIFGNRLRGSIALFYGTYDGVQVPGEVELPSGQFISYTINGGEAVVKGFEAELTARPVDGLTLRGSVGYVKTNIKSIDDFGTTLNNIGLPLVRPWTGALSMDYEREVSEDIVGSLNVAATFRGEAYESIFRDLADLNNAYTTVDASIGLGHKGVKAVLYIENIFDEIYWLSNETGFSHRGTFVDFIPRTWGIRLTGKF